MRVLFVCTGNVFRSVSAEYCLRKHLADHGVTGITVASAGTRAPPEPIDPVIVAMLERYGIDVSGHRQRRLSQAIVDESDAIIAIGRQHQAFIREHFGVDVPLFNEVAGLSSSSVLDVDEAVADLHNAPEYWRHLELTVNHIHEATPAVANWVLRHRR